VSLISRYFIFLVTIVLLLSYFIFGTYRNWPYKIESDGKYYYQFLVSGYYDHDLDFSNNYTVDKYDWMRKDIDNYNFKSDINEITGRPYTCFTVGPAILWLPFFVLASFIGKLIVGLGFDIDLNPYGLYMQYSTMLSAVVYAVLSIYLMLAMAKTHFSTTISQISLWLMLFMTQIYYYTVFEPSMSHIYDLFTFTLLIYVWSKCSKQSNLYMIMLLGCVSSLHVLVRTQNIVTLFILSIFMLIRLINSFGLSRALLSKSLVYIAVIIVGISPIPIINTYLFGVPFLVPQGNSFLAWSHPHLISLLFSERNGFFSHHPIYLFGLAGFIAFLIKNKSYDRYLFTGLLLVFASQVYINATVDDWWAGHSFGQRRLLSSIPLFVFGICYILDEFSKKYNLLYQKYISSIIVAGTIIGLYLTMIHVFLWDYEMPHNIILWMFYYAPIYAIAIFYYHIPPPEW
jgi:hypothetical protein